MDLLGPFVLFISGVQIKTPSTWNIKVDFPFIQGFGILMATSFVPLLRAKVGISMLFNGGRKNLPH
jgi:hypothetical protein